jgi:hypothetical protein
MESMGVPRRTKFGFQDLLLLLMIVLLILVCRDLNQRSMIRITIMSRTSGRAVAPDVGFDRVSPVLSRIEQDLGR